MSLSCILCSYNGTALFLSIHISFWYSLFTGHRLCFLVYYSWSLISWTGSWHLTRDCDRNLPKHHVFEKIIGGLPKSKGYNHQIKSTKKSCVERETKLCRCMSREYKGDTWECTQMDKYHTWRPNKNITEVLTRTQAQRQKHMQHTNTVCGTEEDERYRNV